MLQGTGFYCVQSTINHSCAPNASASCLASGEMVITALADIEPDSEVLLSYIEETDADLRERQAMLRDYGFTCACARCEAEQLTAGLQSQTL
jgi:SET domain-containing protein